MSISAGKPDLLAAAKNLVAFIREKWPNHPEGDYLHGGALIEIENAIKAEEKKRAVEAYRRVSELKGQPANN